MKKTKQQSWKGFIQGVQLCAGLGFCCAPPMQGGFAGGKDAAGAGSAAPGRFTSSPQAAAVLVAGCPADLLVRGCSRQPTWKPSGTGADWDWFLLNPIAWWKHANKVQACVGASEFLWSL